MTTILGTTVKEYRDPDVNPIRIEMFIQAVSHHFSQDILVVGSTMDNTDNFHWNLLFDQLVDGVNESEFSCSALSVKKKQKLSFQ